MAKLLVVDDEPNVLFSMEEGLKSNAIEVITARTAREGIELVGRERPDAVILDVRLPDMSGLHAFDLIRQVDPRLPVVVITAFAATETASARSSPDTGAPPISMRSAKDSRWGEVNDPARTPWASSSAAVMRVVEVLPFEPTT